MRATLFGVAASHPSLAAELMLRHKGVDYRRVDLPTVTHRALLRLLGYPGKTVPALRIDGAKVQGTTRIARALDALIPSPPLFPDDPDRRRAVEEADSWGDEVLQPLPRRLTLNALKHDRSALGSYLEGAKLGIPHRIAVLTAPPIAAASRRVNRATDENARRDLAALPAAIDRVDELIERDVIGGPERNAADFQIATSISLLLTLDDVRPMIEGRPAERLARDVVPHQPGHVPRQDDVEVVRAPLPIQERSRRTLDQRLALRFPQLAAALFRRFGRLPPSSRLRQAVLRRGVRLAVEAYNRRDLDAVAIGYSPDLEYYPYREFVEAALAEPCYHGPSGYHAYIDATTDVWGADVRLEPTELIDLGDRFVLLADMPMRAQASGVPLAQRYAGVSTLKDGRVIRQDDFLDPAEALRAVGL